MTTQEIQEIIRQTPLLVAYFSYPECSVCKVLRPRVEALTRQMGIDFVYVDTHLHPEISGQFIVFAVPTIVIFVEGKEAKRFSRHFGMEELAAFLERMQEFISMAD